MNNRTFAIIKPDAIKNGDTGKIYNRIIEHKFEIISAKLKIFTLYIKRDLFSMNSLLS